MSEENKENGFNHVKTFTKIIFIFSVLVFNDNESKITVVKREEKITTLADENLGFSAVNSSSKLDVSSRCFCN